MARSIIASDVDKTVRGLYSLTLARTNEFLEICKEQRSQTDSVDAEIYLILADIKRLLLIATGLNIFGAPASKQPSRSPIYNVTYGEWYKTKIQAAAKCNVLRQRVHVCLANGGVIDNNGKPILLGYRNAIDKSIHVPFNTQIHIVIPYPYSFLIKNITGLTSADQVAQRIGEIFTREDDALDRRLRDLLQH